jgi:hypothetical protein
MPLTWTRKNPQFLCQSRPRFRQLLKAAFNAPVADERALEGPEDPTRRTTPQIGLYAHPCQAGRTSSNRPGVETPDYPAPCIGVIILRGSYASAQAHHYAQVQHIVVDLAEPRSLRPNIGWPASGAMWHPAYQPRRIHLLRDWVNKGVAASACTYPLSGSEECEASGPTQNAAY